LLDLNGSIRFAHNAEPWAAPWFVKIARMPLNSKPAEVVLCMVLVLARCLGEKPTIGGECKFTSAIGTKRTCHSR
jgi:hypothetical protein